MLGPFRHRKVFLPVIHLPFGEAGAYDSVDIAAEAGADGVFLINQGMSAPELLSMLPRLRGRYPGLWVGVNLLGMTPEAILALPEAEGIDGVWADDAGVDALDPAVAARSAAAWREARSDSGWGGLYFGGTAFKTQAPIAADRLPEVGRAAAAFVDVVTTSGPGTGRAASVDKVRRLREAIGDHPLALASGVTPDNVDAFLPHVDAYLVATGIEVSFGRLDAARTSALAARIHAG